MKERTVLQAKRLGIVSCSRQDALGDIAQRMADDDISALVVVNPTGDLAGIISRSDLLHAYMEAPDRWRTLLVEDFMTRDVVTVSPGDRLLDAARLMLGNRIHRVVVVQDGGAGKIPIAVISDSDLVCDLADAG